MKPKGEFSNQNSRPILFSRVSKALAIEQILRDSSSSFSRRRSSSSNIYNKVTVTRTDIGRIIDDDDDDDM